MLTLRFSRRAIMCLLFGLSCHNVDAQVAPPTPVADRTTPNEANSPNVAQPTWSDLFIATWSARATGRYGEAIKAMTQMLEKTKATGDKAGEGAVHLGFETAYRMIGMTPLAEASTAAAEEALKAETNAAEAATAWMLTGYSRRLLKQADRVLPAYERALKLARSSQDRSVEAFTESLIGTFANENGRYQEAATHLEKARQLAVESRDPLAQAWVQLSISWSEINSTTAEEKMAHFERTLHALAKVSLPPEDGTLFTGMRRLLLGDRSLEAQAWIGITLVHLSNNTPDKALVPAQKALELLEKSRFDYSRPRLLSALAMARLGTGDNVGAREDFNKAVQVAREKGNLPAEAGALASLAMTWNNEGKWDQALPLAQQSLALIEQKIPYPTYEARIEIARAAEGQGRLDEAVAQRLKAMEELEASRASLGDLSDAKMRFLDKHANNYRKFIALLLKTGDVEGAFEWAEKTKARALIDLLKNGKADLSHGLSPAERAEEARLQNRVDELNLKLIAVSTGENRGASLATLKTELTEANRELASFTSALHVAHPNIASQRAATTVNAVQTAAALPPDAALLLFARVSANSNSAQSLFVVTKQDEKVVCRVFPLDISEDELAELSEDFRVACATPGGQFKSKGRELYRRLLTPAQELIGDKKRLIICPEGALWGVPFAAFTDEKGHFATQKWEISYAYSATAFHAAHQRREAADRVQPRKSLLVLANPDFGTAERFKQARADESRAITADSRALVADSRALVADSRAITADFRGLLDRNGAITPLPGTAREAKSIEVHFPAARVLSQKAATEEAVKSESAQFSILHFATHGLFNDTAPMLSSVILAQPAQNSVEDGFLTAREIFGLDWNADLVVLSACDTGRGEKRSGEGAIGLTWAIFAAGVPSQVVSQWKVDDSATAELMQHFYASLRAGQSKSAAHQAASLAWLKNPAHAHPYFWAPFILVGDGR